VTVISLPTASDRAEWTRIDPFRNRFREKRDRDHPDATRFRLDTRRGEITLRAKRIDLSALRADGAEGVTVTLLLGETEFVATIDFGDRNGRWTHQAATHGNGFVPFDPGDVPLPLTFRILNQGYHTGSSTFLTHVFRTPSEYNLFWSAKYPGPPPGIGMPVAPPPIVDFETELVVVVELGLRDTGGYRVDIGGVADTGTGLRVNWIERTPSGCMVTQDDTRPFVMAAVTRRDGAVTFSGSVSGGGTCP
jgi:hypothetical protein